MCATSTRAVHRRSRQWRSLPVGRLFGRRVHRPGRGGGSQCRRRGRLRHPEGGRAQVVRPLRHPGRRAASRQRAQVHRLHAASRHRGGEHQLRVLRLGQQGRARVHRSRGEGRSGDLSDRRGFGEALQPQGAYARTTTRRSPRPGSASRPARRQDTKGGAKTPPSLCRGRNGQEAAARRRHAPLARLRRQNPSSASATSPRSSATSPR